MSLRPRPRLAGPYGASRATFMRRPPRPGVPGAALGGTASNGLAGLIGGLAAPLLCLGCISSLAIIGLFATMIAAAAYMNKIQKQIRKNAQGAGTMVDFDFITLCFALLCSIYVLTKHRRGVAVSS